MNEQPASTVIKGQESVSKATLKESSIGSVLFYLANIYLMFWYWAMRRSIRSFLDDIKLP